MSKQPGAGCKSLAPQNQKDMISKRDCRTVLAMAAGVIRQDAGDYAAGEMVTIVHRNIECTVQKGTDGTKWVYLGERRPATIGLIERNATGGITVSPAGLLKDLADVTICPGGDWYGDCRVGKRGKKYTAPITGFWKFFLETLADLELLTLEPEGVWSV